MKKILIMFIAFTVVSAVAALLSIWFDERSSSSGYPLSSDISVTGSYTVDGADISNPIPSDYRFGLSGRHTLKVAGRFTKDIPENLCLIVRIDNLQVKMWVNGSQVWEFGGMGKKPYYIKSAGNVWATFISPGISVSDSVVIELCNNYAHRADASFGAFFKDMYFGHESGLVINSIKSSSINSFVSIFTISMGLAVFIFSVSLFRRHVNMLPVLTAASFMYIFCGIWFFIKFPVQNYFFPYPMLNNSLEIVSMLLGVAFMTLFFSLAMKNGFRNVIMAASVLWFAAVLAATFIQFHGIGDYYDFVSFINIGILISVLLITGGLIKECRTSCGFDAKFMLFGFSFVILGIAADFIHRLAEISSPDYMWFKVGVHLFLIVFFLRMVDGARKIVYENARVHILEEQTKVDSFTGLYNKSATEEIINAELASASGESDRKYAFFIVDIDDFKNVNDSYGHAAGDLILKKIADEFKASFRSTDIIGRIGGDEFVIFLSVPDMKWVDLKARQLVEKLCGTVKLGDSGSECPVSVSMGISVFPKDGKDFASLYKNADKALYMVKEKGKSAYVIHDGGDFLPA